MSNHPDPISKTIPLGLAFAAGLGLILMILALGFGAVQGSDANSTVIGVTFAGGLALLIAGIIGWVAVVQPFKHFDDINVAQYTGHHEEPHHEDNAVAIIPHEEHTVTVVSHE